MLKKILTVLLVIFVLIQFVRPEKNTSNDQTYDVNAKYKVPTEVDLVLKTACNDCHSNKTNYPWYANIQPAAWWLSDHVNEGKEHLNFSNFTQLPVAVQNHKFEEVIEVIDENKMPLESYTLYVDCMPMPDCLMAKNLIKKLGTEQMDYLKATYPADSLVMKRRKS
ncbi:MAG: heme-binding domain-containing protein [Flavobacteriaceae bacterium]|nr:heme-binding domain-containing protein [Flavobacteriaceae bacterium]